MVTCTAELGPDYERPPDPFRVGMSFPLRVRLYTCSRQITLTDELTCHTSDSLIVSLDTLSLKATARAPADATIWVAGRKYAGFPVLFVTVVP